MRKTVGLIGFGMIGRHIYNGLVELGLEVPFIVDPVVSDGPATLVKDISAIDGIHADVIVEAAHADVISEYGIRLAERSDLIPFSVTAFADPVLRSSVIEAAKRVGNRICIPHGAILGLDGLFDGRKMIQSVTITTIKHPKKLGLDPADYRELTKIYDGPTADICAKFPRNVNVHAVTAIAGIGFEKTQSILYADPGTDKMKHVIEVTGNGLAWSLNIESYASGDVTGAYTPESALQSIVRYCGGGGSFTIL